METVAPETGLPWLSTTLTLTVTLGPQAGEVIVLTVVVEVAATVFVDNVDTIVSVEVAVETAPNGEKRRIVDRGFLNPIGSPKYVALTKPGLDPTTHPLLGEVM